MHHMDMPMDYHL